MTALMLREFFQLTSHHSCVGRSLEIVSKWFIDPDVFKTSGSRVRIWCLSLHEFPRYQPFFGESHLIQQVTSAQLFRFKNGTEDPLDRQTLDNRAQVVGVVAFGSERVPMRQDLVGSEEKFSKLIEYENARTVK